MKHIKNFKLFESNYNFEEFVEVVCSELSKYEITPTQVKNIISNYEDDIRNSIDQGESPYNFVNQIIKDLDLESDKGHTSIIFNNPNKSVIKYL